MTPLASVRSTQPMLLVEKTLALIFGASAEDPSGSHAAFGPDKYIDPSLTIIWRAAFTEEEEFQHRGYRTIQRFVVLPSLSNPRFLLPYRDAGPTNAAMRSYLAYSNPLLRRFVAGLASRGLPYLRRRTVLVASKMTPYFESISRSISGKEKIGVAISLGTSGLFRKASAQWTTDTGDAVCHLKLALTSAANNRIRREAHILQTLRHAAGLRHRIPQLIDTGSLQDARYLVETTLAGDPGPAQFDACHRHFLKSLQDYQPSERPGPFIVQAVAGRFEGAKPYLGKHWDALGADVLRSAAWHLRNSHVPCGWGHGDFAPWNTRYGDNEISAFDWETAAIDIPHCWDPFHFEIQTRSLLKRTTTTSVPRTDEGLRALYLLYLLDSAGQLCGEQSPSNGVAFREAEIRRELRRASEQSGLKTGPAIPSSAWFHYGSSIR